MAVFSAERPALLVFTGTEAERKQRDGEVLGEVARVWKEAVRCQTGIGGPECPHKGFEFAWLATVA